MKRLEGVDPEHQRYRRAYPKFPGVKTCVDLLGRSNVHGAYQDSVLLDLEAHVAATGTVEIAAAFSEQTDEGVRAMLLAIIAERPAPSDLALFVAALDGAEWMLWTWAARGLYRLNTPDARQALWNARSRIFADPAEAARFRQMLDDVKGWK